LDTHAFLWWVAGDEALPSTAQAAIADQRNDIFVSAASAWEISTKHRLGRLPGVVPLLDDIEGLIEQQSFVGLPVSIGHGQVGGALGGPLRDPFDRMLIAQAIVEHLVLVSNEQIFESYGVPRLW
jgi:PIN domain nuclease of toxin-antitoxin system